jgi:hypothetical protein
VNESFEIIIRPEAEEDIRDAYWYYEECVKGLGADFILSVDAIFSRIQRNLKIYPKLYKNIRPGLIQRFPFGVFYLIEKRKLQSSRSCTVNANQRGGKKEFNLVD